MGICAGVSQSTMKQWKFMIFAFPIKASLDSINLGQSKADYKKHNNKN